MPPAFQAHTSASRHIRGRRMTKSEPQSRTRSQQAAADVAALLRARTPLLWIATREEARAEGHLIQAAMAAGYVPRTWDCAAGVCDIAGKPVKLALASERGYEREVVDI